MKAQLYVLVAAAVLLGACPTALGDDGDEAKEALADKQGDALKMEREAELEQMREFENVSATLSVAVKSCVLQPVASPKGKGKEESSVDVGGDWGELAGSLFRAVGREMAENAPADTAKAGGDKVYVFLDVTVKNLSAKTQLVIPGDFTLQTPEGYAAGYNVKTYGTVDPFDGIYLPPGATSGGKLVFVLPPRDEFTLHYYNPDTGAAGTKRIIVMRGD